MNNQISTPRYAFFLGSHPALSANEALGALLYYGFAPVVDFVTPAYLIVALERELPADFLAKLGGTTRIARVLAERETLWTGEDLWQHIPQNDSPKITLGLSSLGLGPRTARDLANDVKAIAREHSLRLRFILSHGKYTMLNAAQVLFNDLLTPPNREFVLVHESGHYLLLESTHIQDISAYERRDIKRPVRDPRVGMLPPKLAQIMLNLASSHLPTPPPSEPLKILDPFCGLGTVLQEGWLQGHTMLGSDSNPRMVDGAKKNTSWVMKQFPGSTPNPHVRNQDILQPFPDSWQATLDAIVTEPFLGRPLHAPLTGQRAHEYLSKLADLYHTFFRHAHRVLKPGGVILFLFPAIRQNWRGETFALLPDDFLDAIAKLGYIPKQLSRPELAHVLPPSPRQSFLYSRPDALVGREITLWEKH